MSAILRVEPHAGVTIVRVDGALDESGLETFEAAWARARFSGKVVVDFSGITRADEGTWAFFAEISRKARRDGGALVLCNLGGPARNSIFVSSLVGRIPFYETEADALGALSASAAAAPAAPPDLDRLARVVSFLSEQVEWHRAAGISEVVRPLEAELRDKSALYEHLLDRHGLHRDSHERSVRERADASPDDARTFAATGRRQFPRYRVTLTATMEWPARTELAVVRNLSEGGAGVASNQDLALGSRLELRIMNLPGVPPVKLPVQVRWCRRVSTVGAFDHESGLLFLGEATPELALLRPAVRDLVGRAPEVPWA